MSLSKDYVEKICKLGQGEKCCAFLMKSLGGDFACAKGSSIESVIRERLGQGTMISKGDNCTPKFQKK